MKPLMVPLRTILARILFFAALYTLTPGQGIAGRYSCNTSNVGVLGGDSQSASLACEGATRAVAFLKGFGLDVSYPIDVELVDQVANRAAAGHLVASSKKALVLNYPAFQKFQKWLRVPIDAEIYRVLVAHEVAHVVAAHNFQVAKPTVQAHEYIAYVTSFATMSLPQREIVLSQFSGDGFETEQQMNTTIYLCDPMRFGAEAYRHFVKQDKHADYLWSILSGHVINE